jgi:hypothetical protein
LTSVESVEYDDALVGVVGGEVDATYAAMVGVVGGEVDDADAT